MAVHRRPQTLRHRRVAAIFALAIASGCATQAKPDNGFVCKTWAAQADRQEVVATGTVTADLPTGGFLLQLTGDCDLLVRVEISPDPGAAASPKPNATVIVKGEYGYNAMGGVIAGGVVQPVGAPSP
jgi:hypothetical protein